MVGCGAPIDATTRVVVVDPDSRANRDDGAVGEIWVQGPAVAAGYFERPAETDATFGARTADGDGPFLRTGDLGVVVEGELFVTGRIKDTIIVNGRSLDATDIEEAIREDVAIERAGLTAALSIVDGDQERFVVVQEAAGSASRDDVARAIEVVVAGRFGVRPDAVELVKLGTLPRTTSGKLRRAAAAASYRDGRLTSGT
jgi:acyl-CoA synthetase (AMP-forming)/AMP-acid ligase II